jgi:hypothetical protein
LLQFWFYRVFVCGYSVLYSVIELFILSFPLLLMNDECAFVDACDCILCISVLV